ncbi:MAG: ABC transporter ATP-binding protein [Chloroflexi bacterium]|nr:MAG: ABC transporter ATP-binding protein [Chloroflexota bacterium]
MTSAQPAFRAIALSKAYGKRLAVDHLDLQVDRGELFGFLGPNGAGKTTTIRMALGLVAPTNGSVEILGMEVRHNRSKVLPRVGALVESPALYGYLSGRNNLRVFADLLGGVSAKRIDEVLEIVSLKGREQDRVKTYSMGMKQRLGLAIALLSNPDLLILDEPANGLDPAGIVEMRDLLRELAGEGKTVFISSHVLSEVQQICTRVAIINHGKLVRLAPVAELLDAPGEFEIQVDSPDTLVSALKLQEWGREARVEDGLVITRAPEGRGRNLISFLVQNGHDPDSVSERQRDLEDIFLSLTGGDS